MSKPPPPPSVLMNMFLINFRDDILVKKNSDVMEEISTENLEKIVPRQPKKKVKTKVAKAKALLRKGIKTNTKILFDEEGNVS